MWFFHLYDSRQNSCVCPHENLIDVCLLVHISSSPSWLAYTSHMWVLFDFITQCMFFPVSQECDKVGTEFPNFNFNVSHHGDYVAIASEPLCLVGLDIVSCIIPGRETVPQFVQNFSSYFSILEWNKIINAGTYDEILAEFYRYSVALSEFSNSKNFDWQKMPFSSIFQYIIIL